MRVNKYHRLLGVVRLPEIVHVLGYAVGIDPALGIDVLEGAILVLAVGAVNPTIREL